MKKFIGASLLAATLVTSVGFAQAANDNTTLAGLFTVISNLQQGQQQRLFDGVYVTNVNFDLGVDGVFGGASLTLNKAIKPDDIRLIYPALGDAAEFVNAAAEWKAAAIAGTDTAPILAIISTQNDQNYKVLALAVKVDGNKLTFSPVAAPADISKELVAAKKAAGF